MNATSSTALPPPPPTPLMTKKLNITAKVLLKSPRTKFEPIKPMAQVILQLDLRVHFSLHHPSTLESRSAIVIWHPFDVVPVQQQQDKHVLQDTFNTRYGANVNRLNSVLKYKYNPPAPETS